MSPKTIMTSVVIASNSECGVLLCAAAASARGDRVSKQRNYENIFYVVFNIFNDLMCLFNPFFLDSHLSPSREHLNTHSFENFK